MIGLRPACFVLNLQTGAHCCSIRGLSGKQNAQAGPHEAAMVCQMAWVNTAALVVVCQGQEAMATMVRQRNATT